MHSIRRFARYALIPAAFAALSCMNDSGDGGKGPSGDSDASGYFRVSLTEKTVLSSGYPIVQGSVYDGPQPSPLAWSAAAKSGSCILYTPKALFCDPGCGSGSACVEESGPAGDTVAVCKEYPNPIGVGKVTLTGVKTLDGDSTVELVATLGNYNPKPGVYFKYEPFAEGDEVKVSAAGDTVLGAFTVAAKAIARLAVANESIVLEDGKPIQLRWTPPAEEVGSVIDVEVDISHHGGTKGKIVCEAPDIGSLDIAASLVDALKALGVSGWPKLQITRRSTGTNAEVGVDLEIVSPIYKALTIPGLISCATNEDCPDGTTCTGDMQCK